MSSAILKTNVPGLDDILGGGLARGALVFLVGPPGAGKTVLASQILFQAARTGTPSLICSTYSEGHVKLIEHLRGFEFFDEQVIGGHLNLFSLQSVIGDDLKGAANAIAQTIRQTGARLVLIDGLRSVPGLFDDRATGQRILSTLATLLTYLDVTLFITLDGNGRDREIGSDLTTADVVLGLEYTVDGWQHVRRLDVIKQRGSASLAGLHSYTISERGVIVYPRLETHVRHAIHPPAKERAGFGLPELDVLLKGGLTAGTTTILAGAPGVGKTILGLHWALAEARPDNATVFLTFGEHEGQLCQKAAAFNLDLQAAIHTGAVTFIRLPPIEVNPDIAAAHLLTVLETMPQRLVIDDIDNLLLRLGPRTPDYLATLADHLYKLGVTSLFLLGIEPFVGFQRSSSYGPISLVGENVILVQHEMARGTLHRVLSVLKMRFSDYDPTLRELVLGQNSVRVLAPYETESGVLEDVAKANSGGSAPGEGPPAQQ